MKAHVYMYDHKCSLLVMKESNWTYVRISERERREGWGWKINNSICSSVLPLIGPKDWDTPHWPCVSWGHRNGPNPPFDYFDLLGCIAGSLSTGLCVHERRLVHPMLPLRMSISIAWASPSQSQTAGFPAVHSALLFWAKHGKALFQSSHHGPWYPSPSALPPPPPHHL